MSAALQAVLTGSQWWQLALPSEAPWRWLVLRKGHPAPCTGGSACSWVPHTAGGLRRELLPGRHRCLHLLTMRHEAFWSALEYACRLLGISTAAGRSKLSFSLLPFKALSKCQDKLMHKLERKLNDMLVNDMLVKTKLYACMQGDKHDVSGTEKQNTQGCTSRAGCSVGVKNAGGAPCAGISSVPQGQAGWRGPSLGGTASALSAQLRKQLGSQQQCQHHHLTHRLDVVNRQGRGYRHSVLAPLLTSCHRAGQAALSASVSPSAKQGSKGLVCLEAGGVSQRFLMRGVWGTCVRLWEFQISDSTG